jgi:hypothetical protein
MIEGGYWIGKISIKVIVIYNELTSVGYSMSSAKCVDNNLYIYIIEKLLSSFYPY